MQFEMWNYHLTLKAYKLFPNFPFLVYIAPAYES